LEENKEFFLTHEERKKHRVFEKISGHLRNKRTARQCRSHHQKIMNKSKRDNIESAIEYLREIIKKKMNKIQTEKIASEKKEERTKANEEDN
jgi:membrane glycosyltransferase